MTVRLKYCLSCTFVLSIYALAAQPNQAVVTIFGNPLTDNNVGNLSSSALTNDFNEGNPYIQSNNNPPSPQEQQLIQAQNNTIEPSLENGFHMRFEISASQPVERMTTSGYASAGSSSGSYGKTKKHSASMAERSFNFKKKVKTWLPKRKKKYRPHLCGRF